jgi:hypothetical protein
MLKCYNDVTQLCWVDTLPYDDGQGSPNSQRPLHRCFVRAEKSKIQATWGLKNNGPPFSTHVNKRVPCLYFQKVSSFFSSLIHIAIEYV